MVEEVLSVTYPEMQDLDRLWNASDPKATEDRFREMLPAAEAVSGRERGYLVELLSQISRAESAQGKLPAARSTLERAEHLLLENPSVYPASARVRYLLEMGRLNVLEKIPSQARPLLIEAWTLAVNSREDYLAVDIALTMSLIEPQKLQQEWIVRAIELVEKSSLPSAKRWLGSLHASLGWKRYDLRQYSAALESFEKASNHLKVNGTARELFLAKWSIGKVLRVMGRTEEALAAQNSLLADLDSSSSGLGRLYEELAECLHILKRSPEDQHYFELAYRALSNDEWVTDNQPVALKRLKDLGKVKDPRHKPAAE